ncbi:MAG: glycosyl transferase, partial [Candidatus Rokuibacteriota bacterium]
KWPEKYNGPGHVRWTGRIYGSVLTGALRWRRARVYHGIWGVAPYQSLYEPAPSLLGSLPQMPEWYLMIAILLALSALSFFWGPIKLLLPVLVIAALPPLTHACVSAMRARFPDTRSHPGARTKRRLLTAALHLLQPLARLRGRLREGLTPWRCRGTLQPAPLWPVTSSMWSERWQAQEQRLEFLKATLREEAACVLLGGEHDRWDLAVRSGFFGGARLLMGVEDHGGGQLVRLRWWPYVPAFGPVLTVGFAVLALGALHDDAWPAAAVLGLVALLFAVRTLEQCGAAMATITRGLGRLSDERA